MKYKSGKSVFFDSSTLYYVEEPESYNEMIARKLFIIIIFALFALQIVSQNLVLNPGFEEFSENGIVGWETTALSPDFFNKAINEKTYEEVHCGNPMGKGFLGLMLCGEVTSTKLISKLEKDQDYLLRIHVQKPRSFCPGGVRKITVAFTGGKLPHKESPNNYFYPIPFINLYAADLKPLKDDCTWIEFIAVYKAKGTETFFHIGDFRSNKESASLNASKEILFIDSLENSQCTYIHYDSVIVEKISIGDSKPVIIEGIIFENGKSDLLPASYVALDNLYGLIYRLKNYKIKIIGHTDNVGNKLENLILSKSRSEAVVNYLIKKGIPKSRLSYEGKGDTKPIADNLSEQGRAKNRRVEVELSK